MAQVCAKCGTSVYRTTLKKGVYVGVDCGCAKRSCVRLANGAFSDLTLEHVHDEAGRPIRVTSLHGLRQAEKKYGFSSVVANTNSNNLDLPPQQPVRSIGDIYKRKFGGA